MPVGHRYKIANKKWEFEEIKKLSYQTFVEEIPQHQTNSTRTHTDKFHRENIYIICTKDDKLLAMLAVRPKRPFSLDHKLPDLDKHLPQGRTICEIRLLAVTKKVRFTRVLKGLLEETVKYCIDNNFDMAVISAILKQQKLYRHIGFIPFGPLVGTEQARFQPMYLTVEAHAKSKTPMLETEKPRKANFLPGPVDISPKVRSAFEAPPISHRSKEFLKTFNETKSMLKELVSAKHVEILTGSGTLANDVVAGQLAQLSSRGLILSNGDFGERLITHADNFGLDYKTIRLPWTSPFDYQLIQKTLSDDPSIKWIWAAHLETSTGMLNNIDWLKAICQNNDALLCLDCVSSIGNTPIDLSDVYLASTSSAKGLSSFPGLAMVFYNRRLKPPRKKLPNSLDLYKYSNAGGVAYTISSNHISALHTSIKDIDIAKKTEQISAKSDLLRERLAEIGMKPVCEKKHAADCVITLSLNEKLNSIEVGDSLKLAGFSVNYESNYLSKRNWIQICLMSEVPIRLIDEMLISLNEITQNHRPWS